jgi:hypothetical protein
MQRVIIALSVASHEIGIAVLLRSSRTIDPWTGLSRLRGHNHALQFDLVEATKPGLSPTAARLNSVFAVLQLRWTEEEMDAAAQPAPPPRRAGRCGHRP